MHYSALWRFMRPLMLFSCSLYSGLCVVRVAFPRAPGLAMLLHDQLDIYNGQPISPHSHLALFVCSGFLHFLGSYQHCTLRPHALLI